MTRPLLLGSRSQAAASADIIFVIAVMDHLLAEMARVAQHEHIAKENA